MKLTLFTTSPEDELFMFFTCPPFYSNIRCILNSSVEGDTANVIVGPGVSVNGVLSFKLWTSTSYRVT